MCDPFAENALTQRRMRLNTERSELIVEVINRRPVQQRVTQIEARIAEIDREIAEITAQLGAG